MLGRYSHSSLQSFRHCPCQFKFRYVEKVDVPARLPAHTYLGNVVHHQLRKLHERAAIGKLLPLEDILNSYSAEWGKSAARDVVVTAEQMTVDDYIESGRQMLTEYYRTYQPFDGGKHLGAEMQITFELSGTPYRFRAVIDRLWKRGDGTVEVCDYKTGKLPPQGVNDDTLRRQMGLYQLAIQSSYPQFDSIELAQYYLKHGEVLRRRLRPDELDELAEQFRIEVGQTIDAERKDAFPTKEGPLCNWCDYVNLCPAKRHRRILEDEEAADAEEKVTMETAADLANRFIDSNRRYKEVKQELEALKEQVVNTAKKLSLAKLSGSTADVAVRVSPEEKLPTKSGDPVRFAELSHLVRQWGFEECFSLDNHILIKEKYKARRLTESQRHLLEEFITLKESARVTVVKKKSGDNE